MLWIVLFSLSTFVINLFLLILPSLPTVPTEFTSAVSNFFDLLFENTSFVGFFLPMNMVKIAIPIVIVLVNFKYVYKLVMWIVHKLPVSTD